MSELVARESNGTLLTIQPEQQEFSPAQVATLAQMGVENADRANLQVLFHHSQRTGLDPFLRQIYMIPRQESVWDPDRREKVKRTKWTIQTGIDGYRLIARRAADRARVPLGLEDTQWCGPDGVWVDAWIYKAPPLAARVTVWRGDEKFSAVALYHEYAQTYYNKQTNEHVPTSMWANRPAGQLEKCAEALAYRKAFPLDLSGIYADEEMPAPEQVDETPAEDAGPSIVKRKARTKPVREEAVAEPVQEEEPSEAAEHTARRDEEPAEVVEEAPEQTQEDAAAAAFEKGLGAEPVAEEVTTDGPASIAERKELGMHLQAVYASQETAMGWVSEKMGRPVSKSAELSSSEVQMLIGELKS